MTPPAQSEDSVETQLAVINTKLDILIEQRSDHEGRLRAIEEIVLPADKLADRDRRIRSLEQFKWLLAGAALAGGGSAGAVAAKFLG